MKKRYLRPMLQKGLEGITFIMVVLGAMLQDFTVNFTTMFCLMAWLTIICVNLKFLEKYGKY